MCHRTSPQFRLKAVATVVMLLQIAREHACCKEITNGDINTSCVCFQCLNINATHKHRFVKGNCYIEPQISPFKTYQSMTDYA